MLFLVLAHCFTLTHCRITIPFKNSRHITFVTLNGFVLLSKKAPPPIPQPYSPQKMIIGGQNLPCLEVRRIY